MAKTTNTSKAKRPRKRGVGRTRGRLRRGELDALVFARMRKDRAAAPHRAGAIARGIGRSASAVANCLVRLEEAGKVRQAQKHPRAYALTEGGQ